MAFYVFFSISTALSHPRNRSYLSLEELRNLGFPSDQSAFTISLSRVWDERFGSGQCQLLIGSWIWGSR